MSLKQNKTAVISGGAGGLGVALAEQLLERGWHVFLFDLPGGGMDAARQKFAKKDVSFVECDLTDEAQVNERCDEISMIANSIDLVVYNAGITQIGELTEEPVAAHRKVFDVNYFGALYLLRAMIEPIRKSKGQHLAISSVAGFSPLYLRTAYSASKHALEGLFKSLRAEEQAHGVSVAIAAPSFVGTNIDNPGHEPGGIARPGSAPDGIDYMSAPQATAEIVEGLLKKKSYIPIGRVARIAWRLNRFFPELYFKIMLKRMSKKP